jgi:hypothetical protein
MDHEVSQADLQEITSCRPAVSLDISAVLHVRYAVSPQNAVKTAPMCVVLATVVQLTPFITDPAIIDNPAVVICFLEIRYSLFVVLHPETDYFFGVISHHN